MGEWEGGEGDYFAFVCFALLAVRIAYCFGSDPASSLRQPLVALVAALILFWRQGCQVDLIIDKAIELVFICIFCI